MRNEPMRQQLQICIADIFKDKEAPRVSELTDISVGWESDVHAFTLTHGNGEDKRREEVILRIYQGDDAHAKSAREFNGMQWLYQAGYPVPQVLALERESSPFDKPFVLMERIDGGMLWPIWFGAAEQRQAEYLTQFCQLLVDLHTLDWRPYVDAASEDAISAAHVKQANPYLYVDRFLELGRWFVANSSGSSISP